MTKILHTSDWHLGKKLYKKERWPEQIHFLNWLVSTIKNEQINILIIAGDIFDTPMPPTYALKGLFNFYKEIDEIDSLKKVMIIGGNHDSGKLVESPIPLLGDKFHILGRPLAAKSTEEQNHWLQTQKISYQRDESSTPIDMALFPFFRASDILTQSSDDSLSPEQMLLQSIEQWLAQWSLNREHYNIFIAHHLFGSFFESGSEQGVGLSGLASLPLKIFKNWDLMCLGHIHKPQCIKKETPKAYYSGSPIPMRFSEKEQKSVLIYDIDDSQDTKTAHKEIQVTTLPIPKFRALIQVESNKEQWASKLKEEIQKSHSKDYGLPPFVELTLHFDRPHPSYIDTVRSEISELDIELLNYYQIVKDNREVSKEPTLDAKKIQSARMDELFDLYLEEQHLKEEDKSAIKETYMHLMDEITHQEDHP